MAMIIELTNAQLNSKMLVNIANVAAFVDHGGSETLIRYTNGDIVKAKEPLSEVEELIEQ